MAEQNKAVSRRVFQEGWGQGNLAAIDDIFDPGYVLGGQPSGVQRVKDAITRFRAAFPDLSVTVEDQIAEGDKVMTRLRFQGTHAGKQHNWTLIQTHRYAGGRPVEGWVGLNLLRASDQLDAVIGAGPG